MTALRYILPLALLSFAAPLAAAPVPSSVAPETVLSSVTGFWDNNGTIYRAVLIDDDANQAASLAIYAGNAGGQMKLVAFAPDLVYAGGTGGSLPDLHLSKSGALQIHSENIDVGRDHWEQTYTLANRGGHFVVVGLTTTDTDTLDPRAGGSCDINLLTGKAIKNGKPWHVQGAPVPIEKWTQDNVPKDCPQ